ncbi:MAG: DUF456 domain-containing protein [Rubrobacteraceae bacterium]
MEIFSQPILWIALAGMLVGLLGSVLPGLPGVPLIFLSALLYAYYTGFEIVGGWVIAFLGLFAALAMVADFIGTSYGARRFGASNWGMAGGAIGGLAGAALGFLVFGIGSLFGLILGTIGGVFAGEYLRRQRREVPEDEEDIPFGRSDWQRVSRAAGGVLIGYAVSAIAQGILGLASVIIFVVALFY